MRAVICVPRRGRQEDYDRAWSIVGEHYRQSVYDVYAADSGGERFNLPASRNAAALMAGDWDVAAFMNADCIVPRRSLIRGFEWARLTGRLVVPWDHYYSMTEAGHRQGFDLVDPTKSYFLEQRWRDWSERFAQPFYAPGGDVIIPRSLWDRIGGWDECLSNWEPEDAAMLVKAAEFDRLSGPAYHFWHPGANVPGVYDESKSAWPEYRRRLRELQARGEFTQHLVDEGRDIHDFGNWNW